MLRSLIVGRLAEPQIPEVPIVDEVGGPVERLIVAERCDPTLCL
jgi:hypothetical protein